MHMVKDQRLKFDSKTSLCVFVSYGDEECVFRFYNLKKQRAMRSTNFVFFLHEMGVDLLNAKYNANSELYIDVANVFFYLYFYF